MNQRDLNVLKGTFSLYFLPILAQNIDFCFFAFFASFGGIESVKSEKLTKKTFCVHFRTCWQWVLKNVCF